MQQYHDVLKQVKQVSLGSIPDALEHQEALKSCPPGAQPLTPLPYLALDLYLKRALLLKWTVSLCKCSEM